MSIRTVSSFIAALMVLEGIYKCFWYRIMFSAYKKLKNDDESFFDFLCRIKSGFLWKLRKRFGLRWYYNSRLYKIITILLGIVLVLCGISIFIFIFWFSKNSEYAVYMDILL